VSASLGLSGQAKKIVARRTRWEHFRFGTQSNGMRLQSIFKDINLFEMTPLHGRAPFRERKAGALRAVASQVKAKYRAVMVES
jgi:hypothetical protein